MTNRDAYDDKAETKKTPADAVHRWVREIEASDKKEKDWRKDATDALEIYGEEKKSQGSAFNMLWANTEIMLPALYSAIPIPDVRLRPASRNNPAAHRGAEIIEESLKFYIDEGGFDEAAESATLDMLVPGRATTRVRFKPEFIDVPEQQRPMTLEEIAQAQATQMPPEGALMDEVTGQPMITEPAYRKMVFADVRFEHVQWDDYRRGPGKQPSEMPWQAFRQHFTRDEFRENFPNFEKLDEITFDVMTEQGEEERKDSKKTGEEEVFKKALVWEIWDKEEKCVKWLAPSYKDDFVRKDDDPLGLSGFFDTPHPLNFSNRTTSMTPVVPYKYYKRQARELDRISERINHLVQGLKLRGIYDSTMKEVAGLLNAEENSMLAAEGLAVTMERGGLDKAIWFMPIEQIAKVVAQLYIEREQIKQAIYEITGLSDIVRGSTDPKETLGAQQLKAQTGSRRLARAQKKVQRYLRDLLRIAAEIMAEHFTPELLSEITGKQVTPEVMELLKGDRDRTFNIDIETDSTILPDQEREQRMISELFTGMTGFIAAVGPAVQSGDIPRPVAMKMLKSIIRRFKLGKEVEEALDQAEQNPEQPKPSPEEQKMQMDAKVAEQEAQLNQQKMQGEMQLKQEAAQIDAQVRQQEAALEAQIRQQQSDSELVMQQQKAQAEIALNERIEMIRLESQERIEMRKLELQREVELEKVKIQREVAKQKPKPAKKAA